MNKYFILYIALVMYKIIVSRETIEFKEQRTQRVEENGEANKEHKYNKSIF